VGLQRVRFGYAGRVLPRATPTLGLDEAASRAAAVGEWWEGVPLTDRSP
jgi:hypothetical protein